MSFRSMMFCCVLLLVSCGSPMLTTIGGAEKHDSEAQHATRHTAEGDWEDRLQAGLNRPLRVEFEATTLRDVAAFLRQHLGVPVLIDRAALQDIGRDENMQISVKLHGLTARSVLHHVLAPSKLAFAAKDGALLITTQEAVEHQLTTEVFSVTDLVHCGTDRCPEAANYDALIELITSTVVPESWDEVGGPGSINALNEALIISQTEDVLNRVRNLLAMLRVAFALNEQRGDSQASISLEQVNQSDKAIDKALEQHITADFRQLPLVDAAKFLAKECGVNLVVDESALEDVGLGNDLPLNFECKGMALRHGLTHMLAAIDLTWIVDDGVLKITTLEAAESAYETRVYPVADLLVQDESDALFREYSHRGNIDELIDTLTTAIDPSSWSDVGGPGAIQPFAASDLLVISQTRITHHKIERLLSKLRKHMAQRAKQAPPRANESSEPATETFLVVYHVPSVQRVQSDRRRSANATSSNNDEERSTKKSPRKKRRRNDPARGSNVLQQFGLAPAVAPTGQAAAAPSAVIPEAELLALIVELVAPESWSGEDVYAKAVPGRLVIRQTHRVHAQIEKLFLRLRVPATPINSNAAFFHEFGGGLF